MGCVFSHENKEGDLSREIDKIIKKDQILENSTVKLLLLGAGESGKSTIVKQLKILHNSGYSTEECLKYKAIVFSNTIQSITAIIRAMDHLKIEFSNPERIDDARKIFLMGKSSDETILNADIVDAMKRLWKDEGFLACFKRSNEYQLNDSAEYFLNSLERLAEENYVPSVQDVLHTRVKTTGIIETVITYKNLTLKIVDVGGQRSERKKWIHCFEGIMTMIFVVAMSEYDQLLIEDSERNRMFESMTLFDSVCNNRYFTKSSIILFLNKKDLFKLKIPSSPLNICFPDYRGDNSYDDASDFIKMKFVILNKQEKPIYTHFTCATDTNNISHVFNVITDRIIERNVEKFNIF